MNYREMVKLIDGLRIFNYKKKCVDRCTFAILRTGTKLFIYKTKFTMGRMIINFVYTWGDEKIFGDYNNMAQVNLLIKRLRANEKNRIYNRKRIKETANKI